MVTIIWIITTVLADGPGAVNIADVKTFQTTEECKTFGFENSSRMADWMRGALKVPLDHPAQVSFRCDPGTRA